MIQAIKQAFSQYGIKEIPGETHNPEVLKYFSEIGFPQVIDDETAWCSAFANWCCSESGYQRSNKLNARSWLDVGHRTESPQFGDIVVLWRENPKSWKGHIGFYVNHDEDYIYILGGNQGNTVKISSYPVNRLLQYRRMDRA